MPYRFEHSRSYTLNDKKFVMKENLIDGEKGLAATFLKKEGNKFNRITIKETSKDLFSVNEKVDEEKETSKELDIKEFKKLLKANKNLEFVKNFFENDRGKYKGVGDTDSDELLGGKKKTTKKASKKVSKKKVSKKKASKKKVSKKY
jgi:hypothetical protein